MKRFLVIAGFLFLVALGVASWYLLPQREPEAAMAFINMYAQYDAVTDRQERVVYEPGRAGNVDRQKLYMTLNSVLTKDLSAQNRLEKASRAREQVAAMRREIDAAAASREVAERAIDEVEAQLAGFDAPRLTAQGEHIIVLMRKRQQLIADVTATLYAINSHTETIMERIIQNEGELPDAHVRSINAQTSLAEDRFERLSRLYRELTAATNELTRSYRAFVSAAL